MNYKEKLEELARKVVNMREDESWHFGQKITNNNLPWWEKEVVELAENILKECQEQK